MAIVLHVTGIGCPIRLVTGTPCPGCGMTRAWIAALHLDFAQAMRMHPLFWLFPPALFLATFGDLLPRRAQTLPATAMLLAFVTVWLIRVL